MKRLRLCAILTVPALSVSLAAAAGPPNQDPKPSKGSKAKKLTPEDREVLKERELLENLDLLQHDLEMIRLLEFLNPPGTARPHGPPASGRTVKENAEKKKPN